MLQNKSGVLTRPLGRDCPIELSYLIFAFLRLNYIFLPSSLPGFLLPPSPYTLVTLKCPPGPPDMPCLTSPIWASVHAVLCSEGSCQRPAYGLDLVHKCVLFGLHSVFLLNLSQHFKKKKKFSHEIPDFWLHLENGRSGHTVSAGIQGGSQMLLNSSPFALELALSYDFTERRNPAPFSYLLGFFGLGLRLLLGDLTQRTKRQQVWPSKAYYLIREIGP